MITVNTDILLRSMERHGYKIFMNDKVLNLIGIRRDRKASDEFDDLFVCLRYEGDVWKKWEWECTTDPGRYYLENGLSKGTAILCPGQYVNTWTIGYHLGRYEALVQARPVRVYRDRNKDYILDYDNKEEGMFGINIHRSNEYKSSNIVGSWSAGCQVFRNPKDFSKLMKLSREQYITGKHYFTYTLFEYGDIYVPE